MTGPYFLLILCVMVCFSWPQSPTPSLPHFPPLGNHKICALCLWACFCFVNKFTCVIFWIPHMSDVIRYLSFSLVLTSLGVITSRGIHVAANGIVCGGLVTKSCPTRSTPGTVAHQPPLSMGFFILFFWLSSIPPYICTTFSLSIHLSMDI